MVGATDPFVYVSASANDGEYLVCNAKNVETIFRPLPRLFKSSLKIASEPCRECEKKVKRFG
jgi:hypothetical protein